MIPLFGSTVGQEELDEIRSSFDAQWLGIGPKCRLFEERFAARIGCSDFVMVNSGSNALLLAVKLLYFHAGSELILPSFTWVSCAHAVMLNNLKPVFCDVDLESCNVRAQDVEPFITKKTGAVMVVHYAGKPVDMEPILNLGFPVIEDAAHAVDSKIEEKYCGTIGHIGIFSFDAVKNLTTAEGGGIASRNPGVLKQARNSRYCGIAKSGFDTSKEKERWWEHRIDLFFPKIIPNDICASIGLAQLKKLDRFQSSRKKMWETYDRELSSEVWLKTPPGPADNERHSYFTYFIRLNNDKRDDLAKYLLNEGIYTSLRYHPLHLNKIYESEAKLKNCEELNKGALNIPLHPNLSESDVGKVITRIKKFGRLYC